MLCFEETVNNGAGSILPGTAPPPTAGWSRRAEPDEVKMVLYIVEECGMPCFSLAVTE